MSESRDLKILEAILFTSTGPVLESDLKDKIINKNKIHSLLIELQNLYSSRGINFFPVLNFVSRLSSLI